MGAGGDQDCVCFPAPPPRARAFLSSHLTQDQHDELCSERYPEGPNRPLGLGRSISPRYSCGWPQHYRPVWTKCETRSRQELDYCSSLPFQEKRASTLTAAVPRPAIESKEEGEIYFRRGRHAKELRGDADPPPAVFVACIVVKEDLRQCGALFGGGKPEAVHVDITCWRFGLELA